MTIFTANKVSLAAPAALIQTENNQIENKQRPNREKTGNSVSAVHHTNATSSFNLPYLRWSFFRTRRLLKMPTKTRRINTNKRITRNNISFSTHRVHLLETRSYPTTQREHKSPVVPLTHVEPFLKSYWQSCGNGHLAKSSLPGPYSVGIFQYVGSG